MEPFDQCYENALSGPGIIDFKGAYVVAGVAIRYFLV